MKTTTCDIKNPLDKIYGKLDVAEKKDQLTQKCSNRNSLKWNMDRKTNFNR